MSSFQESAETWRAKAHLSRVKTPTLLGICVLVLVALFFIVSSLWESTQSTSFELLKDGASSNESGVNNSPDLANEAAGSDETIVQNKSLYIHVGGAVVSPGVYELVEGSRIQTAIDAAGGFREDAGRDGINLARLVSDGEQIIVPTEEEISAADVPSATSSGSEQTVVQGKVNINTASLADLTTLPGIGEVTAQKIINERESQGRFVSPEDIMRVAGIGEKKFAQLVDVICV